MSHMVSTLCIFQHHVLGIFFSTWEFWDLFGQTRGERALNLKEGVGLGHLGGEVWLVLTMQDVVGQRKLDLGIVELFNCWHLLAEIPSTFTIWIQVGPTTLLGTHFSVVLGDSTPSGQVQVFLVHVVGATA